MLSAGIETPVDGLALRVARCGSGEPLVLLHGYPENLQIWSALAPRLAARYRSIAFDWPGMGSSAPWKGGATPADQSEHLLRLLDAWKIDRAAVAGHDMGAQPALVFGARHPDRVSRLIVMNCLAFPDEKTSWEVRLLRKFGWNRAILRRFPRAVFSRAQRTFLPTGERLPEDLRENLWDGFRRKEAREFIVRLCAGFQGSLPRLPELYATIRRPTLVLWGAQDRHFPPVHARRLHAAIPGSRLEVLAGAEHWMVWHRADDVAAAILDFSGRPAPRADGGGIR